MQAAAARLWTIVSAADGCCSLWLPLDTRAGHSVISTVKSKIGESQTGDVLRREVVARQLCS
jgi:hypothetical protein